MSLAPALLLAALLAASAGPDLASDAFARGDYARAESLALEQAKAGPGKGAALYLAALARFRRGESAGALALLDEAWSASDRPAAGAWHFNRGSCLYELGRFAEAESDYLESARLDDSLAAVSLIDAGFAALDAGAPERARSLAERARAIASATTLPLLDELVEKVGRARAEEAYRAGLAAFDAGEFAAARSKFLEAAALEPGDGRSRIMSGASALQLGARADARADLELALKLELLPAEAQIARDYLDELAAGLAARGTGWAASAQLAAGFDSNALQTGFLEPNEFTGANATTSPSAFSTTSLGLSYRARPGERLTAELGYGFDQLLYFSGAASDRSLQQHALLGSLEVAARDDLRFGLSLGAQLAFTGLGDFRLLQLNGVSALWAALDEGDRLSTRLELGFEPKLASSEFDYLAGKRFDASLVEELRLPGASVSLGYRFRAELLGIARQKSPPPEDGPLPPLCNPGCTLTLIDPFGYTSHTLWLAGRAALGARWLFELSGGAELRSYTDDNETVIDNVNGPSHTVDVRRRQDTRWFAGAGATFSLSPRLGLSLRYELVLNRSNIDSRAGDGSGCGPPDYQCHTLDAEVRSYDKHVVSLGAAMSW